MGGGAGEPVTVRAQLWSRANVLEALAILAVLTLFASDQTPLVVVPLLLVIASTQRHGAGRLSLPTLMLGLAAADVSRLTGWWPCDVACAGGAHYQSLAGISVVWPALLAHLGLAALAIRDAKLGAWCAWTIRLCWFLNGVALFFLLIAWQLDLHCLFCRLIQLGTLLSLFLVRPLAPDMRWWHAAAWVFAGWLVANAAFHHQPVMDAPTLTTTPTPPTTAADEALYQRADANRRQGDAHAPQCLELVVDFTCSHCAELHGPLLSGLKPALAAGRVELITRHLVRPKLALHRDLARLAFAAAALSSADYRTTAASLIGSRADANLDSVRARLSESLALTGIDAELRDHGSVLEQLIDDDQRRAIALDAAVQTPSMILIDRANGAVVKRWQGGFDTAAAIAELLALIATP